MQTKRRWGRQTHAGGIPSRMYSQGLTAAVWTGASPPFTLRIQNVVSDLLLVNGEAGDRAVGRAGSSSQDFPARGESISHVNQEKLAITVVINRLLLYILFEKNLQQWFICSFTARNCWLFIGLCRANLHLKTLPSETTNISTLSTWVLGWCNNTDTRNKDLNVGQMFWVLTKLADTMTKR